MLSKKYFIYSSLIHIFEENINMKNLIYFLLIIFVTVSCAPAYTPNTVNVPLFSSQNEVQFAITTGTSGIDAQTGYAPTDHIGVILNGSYANRSDSNNYHRHNFIECGGGYYTKMGSNGRLELLGGYGMGNVDAHFKGVIYDYYTKTTLKRIFIQPSIGNVSDFFEIAFAPRLVFVHVKSPLDTLNKYPTDPFLEPTITLKVGWKYIKFVTQFGLSLPLVSYTYYINEPILFSIGFIGKIPSVNKSKKIE